MLQNQKQISSAAKSTSRGSCQTWGPGDKQETRKTWITISFSVVKLNAQWVIITAKWYSNGGCGCKRVWVQILSAPQGKKCSVKFACPLRSAHDSCISAWNKTCTAVILHTLKLLGPGPKNHGSQKHTISFLPSFQNSKILVHLYFVSVYSSLHNSHPRHLDVKVSCPVPLIQIYRSTVHVGLYQGLGLGLHQALGLGLNLRQVLGLRQGLGLGLCLHLGLRRLCSWLRVCCKCYTYLVCITFLVTLLTEILQDKKWRN